MASVKTEVTAKLSSSSFDCSTLEVHTVRGREAISEPFFFDVEILVVGDTTFTASATLGKDVRLTFLLDGVEVRHVNGIVGAAVDGDVTLDRSLFQLRIVPRLQRLAYNSACEVFLGKTVMDIATEKLGRVSVAGPDLVPRLIGQYETTEFRLQYQETDLAFVSRHLEHAGIAYSFDHSGDTDVLVFTDDNGAFGEAVGPATLHYSGEQDGSDITTLQLKSTMFPASHAVNDYLPSHPKLDLGAKETLDVPFQGEVIEFGTGHTTAKQARDLATMRAQSRQALAEGYEGKSTLPHVEAARTIGIDGHPRVGADRLLVVWVEHELVQTTSSHFDDSKRANVYQNRFRATLGTRTYRPELRTPRPKVAGTVTAMTDSPKNGLPLDTAILDKEGRYTVHFLFDNADGVRPVSSALVRMMQPHAGAGYGMHFPLKPGIEVAIAFYEGDPDRPLIAGAVPNALTWSPTSMDNAKTNHLKTVSGIVLKMKDS